jgi:UDP-glucose 4,6-dehydratase/3,5-epimerase/4-reductase
VDKANCLNGNAVLPGVVAETCAEAGIPWGHVSSGCIFTGDGPDDLGFAETDVPNFSFRTNNCSFYSGTKALGEEALGYRETAGSDGLPQWTCASEQGYIWRLRIPFDHEVSPRNYLQKLLSYSTLLEARNSLSHLGEFAAACLQCYTEQLPYGIYNLTNPGSVTTREVTELILAEGKRREAAGLANPFPSEFSFFQDEDEFMQKAAQTPRSNCVLNTDKAVAAGIQLTPVHEALKVCLENWGATEADPLGAILTR